MKQSFSILFALALVFSVSAQAAEKKCVFGEDLGELEANKRFVIKKNVIKTFKLSRMKGDRGNLLYVAVDTAFDKRTRNYYHVNRTFMDQYDGGNTIGWVEDVTGASKESTEDAGKVVAEISDSSFWPCHLKE